MQLFSSPPDTSPLSLRFHRSNSSNFQSSSSHPNLCKINSPTLKMERFWALTSGFSSNKDLVAHLQRSGMIRSNKVAEVMKSVDRGLFLPNEKPFYVDSPSDIGFNATISAPHMHASCLQLLEKHLQPGMRALDVGSGSGYLTACFGLMVGPQGRVVGVDHIPELVASSIQNIQNSSAAPLLEQGTIHLRVGSDEARIFYEAAYPQPPLASSLRVGDGRLGWAEFAPYDAIHVGAAAAEIPHPLLDQLKPGGRMVIPVGKTFQELEVVDKKPDGTIVVQEDATVRYVPLTNREAQLQDY